jgi:hypothetical protein
LRLKVMDSRKAEPTIARRSDCQHGRACRENVPEHLSSSLEIDRQHEAGLPP